MSRTPLSPAFDQRLADWLETDPDHAPPEVLPTVMAAFPSIPQRRVSRVPWRFQTMNRFALLGAAAALIVAVGLGGVLVAGRPTGPDVATIPPSPTPRPTATTTPAPRPSIPSTLTGSFTSPVYGYTIAVDPAWTLTPATIALDDVTPPNAETATDHLGVTGTDTTVQIYAHALGRQSFDAWLAQKHQEILDDATVPDNCKAATPDQWPETPVGASTGRIMTLCNYAVVFAEAGGDAFSFEWMNETFTLDDHYPMPDFLTLLQTVTFR